MSDSTQADRLLIERIRKGDSDAWSELISRYEGRLLAFADSRIAQRAASEDVVQETFIGFLNSLPNYDERRPLEGYLFSICAYKMTDWMRREGRRPAVPLSVANQEEGDQWEFSASARAASSIARSGERRDLEEKAIASALSEQVERWKSRGDWTKLKCIELLFVRGWANKEVAEKLDITEQQVANFKFDFISRLRSVIRKQGLSQDVFPELYQG